MNELWLGVTAGLGLAIPVGAMSIMLLQTSANRGWRIGATGGLAMATVDFAYALATALLGASISAVLKIWGTQLSVAGAVILFVLGALTVRSTITNWNTAAPTANRSESGGILKAFAVFAGATLINPQTALYFLAIAPTVASGHAFDFASAALFAVGVFLGSVAWQQVLAFSGSLLHRVAGAGLRKATGLVGGLLVMGLAITIALKAFN